MSEGKLTARKLKAIRTRNIIYSKGLELIIKKGYNNVTIGEICREAGVSIGGFYHHFESKYQILIEVFRDVDANIKREMAEYIAEGHHAKDIVVMIARLQAEYLKRVNIDLLKQLIINKASLESKYIISDEHAYKGIIEQTILEGQKKQEIRTDMSASDISGYISHLTRGVLYEWCLNDGNYDLTEYVDKSFVQYVDLFDYNKMTI